MKQFFLGLTLLSVSYGDVICRSSEPGFFGSILAWVSVPFFRGKDYFEKCGERKQALKQLDLQNAIALSQARALENNLQLQEAANLTAEELNKIQREQNQVLDNINKNFGRLSTISQVVGTISAVVQIARFSKDLVQGTKNYFRPSYEQQLQNATFEMHKCLVDFQDQQRDNFGMPVACHKQLTKFESLAGCERKQSVVNAYNKMH